MNFQRSIESQELYSLFSDKKLISIIREQLGNLPSYDIGRVVVTAFFNVLSNNFTLDTGYEGDNFLRQVTDYIYNYEYIPLDCIYSMSIKEENLSILLDLLIKYNGLPRYVNLVSWHYRYTRAMCSVLAYIEGSGLEVSLPVIINAIPIVNGIVIRELGSSQPQVVAHILVQLLPNKIEKFRYVGRVLRDSININNTLIAREGSVVTHDLETLLTILEIGDFPVKEYSNEAQYLMQSKSLRPIQVRILKALSYKDKIEVIRHRINLLIENEGIYVLVKRIKEFSEYEWQHAYNVTIMAALTAIELCLNGSDIDKLIVGSLLHDIGKTVLPEGILSVNRDLTEEERNIVKNHPIVGMQEVCKFSLQVQTIVGMHHESPDGSGYPIGKTNIPLLPSIVHIVDVYDAMCRQRDYKKPYDRNYVRSYIEKKDEIFDKKAKEAFLKSSKLFLPGEALFISGIPCVMSDYKDGYYSFYAEGVGKCLTLTDEEVETQLSWQNSVLN